MEVQFLTSACVLFFMHFYLNMVFAYCLQYVLEYIPTMMQVVGLHVACLHDQNKSGFFGWRAFFQPIGAF